MLAASSSSEGGERERAEREFVVHSRGVESGGSESAPTFPLKGVYNSMMVSRRAKRLIHQAYNGIKGMREREREEPLSLSESPGIVFQPHVRDHLTAT